MNCQKAINIQEKRLDANLKVEETANNCIAPTTARTDTKRKYQDLSSDRSNQRQIPEFRVGPVVAGKKGIG